MVEFKNLRIKEESTAKSILMIKNIKNILFKSLKINYFPLGHGRI